ncbi:type VII secretion protein EccB [Sanguibacter suaedae]|uniref:Type VII secretion protein EccB n=1 Tax=Sanguibacter suaedae TaxID=2795737 RepID=A0A934I513_9MICO|nr:type VII secretion protein EccB [Sanguibacter suaedae]MBI9114361.1 type VII secretion protein EccB [Sanguibacter suaedae]
MASKKELVEAQSFSRRRLLTAFVSGTPGGRELEPTKPMRAVVTGAGLSVLLVLGSIGYGLLKPGLPDGWDDSSLVVTEGSGTRFVALKGTLYPVLNTTSARLLVPADAFQVVQVSADKISEVPRGRQVGIPGAPDELPSPANLVGEGWVTCAGDGGGTRTTIGPTASGASASSAHAVVTVDDAVYVVAGRTRHLVPDDRTAVLRALALETVPARPVTGLWLNTVPPGDPLVPLAVAGAGAPAGLPSVPDAVVGSVLEVTGTGDAPRRYVVTLEGRLAPLTEVAYQLYQLGSGATLGPPLTVTAADIRDLETDSTALAPTSWPTALAPSLGTDAPLCLVLDAADGAAQPTAHLASAPDDLAPTTDRPEVVVAAGRGALVRATGDSVPDRGPVQLVDQTGTVFAVPDASDEVLAQLGFTAADVTPVPQSWLALLPSGPELTTEAASASTQTVEQP